MSAGAWSVDALRRRSGADTPFRGLIFLRSGCLSASTAPIWRNHFAIDLQGRFAGGSRRMRPNCRRLLTRAGVALVALLALPVESAAATAVQKCAAAKLRAAGREIAAKMGCYANARKAAAGVDSTCLGKAQGRADMAISKAQGGCRGTAAAIDAAVDTCVAALLGDDPGNGLCPSASAKVLGTSASREVRCEAADVRAQESFTECHAIE